MRKYLPLIFALMCFLLVACNGAQKTPEVSTQGKQENIVPPTTEADIPATTETGTQQTQETLGQEPEQAPMSAADKIAAESMGETGSMLITLSVNPSFDIYVYPWGVVKTVKGANADAEKFVEKHGTFDSYPLDLCVEVLLEQLHREGYLQNASQLDIKAYILEEGQEGYDVVSTVKQGITNYESRANISLSCNVAKALVQPNIDESRFAEVERDDQGNIIKTVEEIPSIEDVPARTVTSFYEADGTMRQQILEEPDGTITVDYTGGIKAKETENRADGSYRETTYNGDGIPVKEVGENAQYRFESTYTATGARSEEIQLFADGRKTVVAFYEDGTVKSVSTDMPDGMHHVTTYYTSGSVETTHSYGPNGDNKYFYDTDGNKVKYEGKDNHGYPVTGTYNKDGSSVMKTKLPDGRVMVSYLDANGKLISQEYE